jgi:alpha-ketoglutarate-dependent taurine dioxygenase
MTQDNRIAASAPRGDDIAVRILSRDERPCDAANAALPIVLEPRSAAVRNRLRDHAADRELIHEALQRHGAVLLRGFAIDSEHDFEQIVLRIPGFRPMAGYFMSEAGRDVVAGTDHVFHTNALVRTGGALRIGAIHSENYYSPDVPTFQCFWCKKPSRLGGETALFAMADVYDALAATCRSKLEREPSGVRAWPLSAIARRYRLSETVVEQWFRDEGWSIVVSGGEQRVVLYKPSVWCHPHTRRRSLQINLSAELHAFDDHILRHARPQYAGWRWAIHRWRWRHARSRRPARTPPASGIGDLLDAHEVEALAAAVWQNRSMFAWRRGDLLILDNRQLAHAGMPGVGGRELRVMLCNPVRLPARGHSGVLEVTSGREPQLSVHARLLALAGAR